MIEAFKHVKHAKVENFTKSLILGSRDSFSSNFNSLEKIYSNRYTLQPRKLKSLLNVPRFRPSENFFILTLHTLRQRLDWPLISISTSQPMHKMCSSPSKKNFCHRFTMKPLIAEILERRLLVVKKVPYNSQMTLHENCWPFMPQMDDLCFGPPTATYSNGHSSENSQRGIFLNFRKSESDKLAPSCKFLGQNSEYPVLQNRSNFSICPKISKSLHLTAYEMANRSHIQKCKPRCVEDPRLHLWTDAWWNWSMPSTL